MNPLKTARASLNAAETALSPSPLDPLAVALAVAREAAQRERESMRRSSATEPAQLVKKSLLGCYVNGVLKFQSRDHEAIHNYARKHMDGAKNFGNDVWVAPVGSFVTADQDKKRTAKKLNKVHKAA